MGIAKQITDLVSAISTGAEATPAMRAAALEQIGALLREHPEALAALRAAHGTATAQDQRLLEAGSLSGPAALSLNAKQAAALMAARPGSTADDPALAALEKRIAAQLLAVPAYGIMPSPELVGPDGGCALQALLGPGAEPVSQAELDAFGDTAPQLTATAAKVDIGADAALMIAMNIGPMRAAQAAGDHAAAAQHAMRAMQGLMVLDLEPETYALLGMNPASMGHWLPALELAASTTGFFTIPRTTIRKVPLTILQMSRLEYSSLTPSTLRVVDAWARAAFDLDPEKDYFVKTGTHSSKFDFRNAHVRAGQEVTEIGQYLLFQTHYAVAMAGHDVHGTGKPVMVGMGETDEWVVREWIEDASGAPTIYHGMPLRTELRAFVDCDTDEVLGVVDYWDEDLMRRRFTAYSDADDPDTRMDAAVWAMHAPVLRERCKRFRPIVEREVAALLPALGLSGQWSIDVMVNDLDGEQMYLIDMAPAGTSALTEKLDEDARAKLRSLDPGHWLRALA